MDFSVVIPAYKAEQTLRQAVDSALSQTLSPREVIVVDDCSPDGQLVVLSGYGDQVRVIRRPTNGGEAAAKNSGVQAATSDWVVTLDADDVWLPTRLQALAARSRQDPSLDIITTDAWWTVDGERGRRYYGGDEGARWGDGDQRRDILNRCFIFSHAAVRRDRWLAVGGMDESRRDMAADWPLWLRLIFNGSMAGLVDEPLVEYAVLSGSLSDSAIYGQRTYEAVMRAALSQPSCTAEEAAIALSGVAAAQREQRRLELMQGVWRGEANRAGLARLAATRRYRKRTRAEAALAALAPARVRRQMTHDPDRPPRT